MTMRYFLAFTFLVATATLLGAAEAVNPLPAYRAHKAELLQALQKTLDTAEAALAQEAKEEKLTQADVEREKTWLEPYRNGETTTRHFPVHSFRADLTDAQKKVEARLAEIWTPVREAIAQHDNATRQALTKLQDDTAAYAMEVFASAKTPAELTPAIETVKTVKLEDRAPMTRFPNTALALGDIDRMLVAAQGVLQALQEQDLASLRSRLNEFEPNRLRLSPAQTQAANEWRLRLRKVENDRLIALKTKELSDLLVSEAPAAKFLELAEKIAFASSVEKMLEPSYRNAGSFGLTHWTNEMDRLEVTFAQNWGRMLQTFEAGQFFDAREQARRLGEVPKKLTPPALAAVEKTKAKVDRAFQESEQAAQNALDRRAHEEFAKVHDTASALALADKLAEERKANPVGMLANELQTIEAELRRIAPCMGAEGADARQLLQPWVGPRVKGWPAEVQALRARVYREWFARFAEAPELQQAPLAEMPLKQAVAQLAGKLYERGEWARLLRVLTAREESGREAQLVSGSDDVKGVRAFLTAQNFEKAEQLAEAARAYRDVLACIGDFVPVNAAAERLKALKKGHPEVFAQPAR